MLLTIAWRNLKRNQRRTAVVLASIVVGVVAFMLYDSLSYGMIRQMLHNAIGSSVGHIQIHAAGYNDNRIIQQFIPDRAAVEDAVSTSASVEAWSARVPAYGLLSSALGSSGGIIVGVHPHDEADVSTIAASIVEGRYLEGGEREVVIGRKMAEKLHVDIGDRVVGMASALTGEVGSELFRVVGIFETVSSEFDMTHVHIPLGTAQRMLALEGNIIQVAVLVRSIDDVESTAADLRNRLGPGYEVLTYRQLLPMLVAQLELYDQMLYVIYLILGLAMIFGIINTMLMSVFERIREFGVLMAIGMKNGKVFFMVMLEALCLASAGTAAGILVGALLTLALGSTGLDLSVFSDGLTSFGAGTTIYPVLRLNGLVTIIVIVPLTTLLGALYPAWKATRLLPVTAIRHV
jgi:putative ABC transport system permease protein